MSLSVSSSAGFISASAFHGATKDKDISPSFATLLVAEPDTTKKSPIDNTSSAKIAAPQENTKSPSFPPPDASENLKKAWNDTTKDMDFGDVLTLMIQFHPPSNLDKMDASAPDIVYTTPSDSEYIQKIKVAIDSAKDNMKYAQSWQIGNWQTQISALERFLGNLEKEMTGNSA